MENSNDVTKSVASSKHPWADDWLAILLGGIVLLAALVASLMTQDAELEAKLEQISVLESEIAQLEKVSAAPPANEQQLLAEKKEAVKSLEDGLYNNPLKAFLAKLGSWKANPLDAFYKGESTLLVPLLVTLAICFVLFAGGRMLQGIAPLAFAPAFVALFALTVLAYLLAGQQLLKYYNLEYALWALLIGMIISNTVGTPKFLRPALQSELFIKTGLVLLGAEILLSRLLVLGLPGIFVAWIVTPIVLITTFWFGQKILRIPSKSLNMVISADMSVCGVSAAIATAAACRAKKEELSLAIGISLAFTVIMMVFMPFVIRTLGMSEVLGGAWIGGTIDSTGAVAAAGGLLGTKALEVAVTVKMIQNILIGVVAFGVAVYWVTYVEKGETKRQTGIGEIWRRFPKFVLGFVGASVVFSSLYSSGVAGKALTESTISASEILRGWFFCMAFVSIGLETNFNELAHFLRGGKPLVLYVCGQSLNLALTLLMAWIMFEKVFPQAANVLGP